MLPMTQLLLFLWATTTKIDFHDHGLLFDTVMLLFYHKKRLLVNSIRNKTCTSELLVSSLICKQYYKVCENPIVFSIQRKYIITNGRVRTYISRDKKKKTQPKQLYPTLIIIIIVIVVRYQQFAFFILNTFQHSNNYIIILTVMWLTLPWLGDLQLLNID